MIRARNPARCAAGLLRFAGPRELDDLVGVLPVERVEGALTSYRLPNRQVAAALFRLGGHRDRLVRHALLAPDHDLLGRLLDLDDPAVNAELLGAEYGLCALPRNLRRQLAAQTSRRDGVTPVPLPEEFLSRVREARAKDALDHALLYAADPDQALHSLRLLGRGADPHGALWACRTLADAGRLADVEALVKDELLPSSYWGPGQREPSVHAYGLAALRGADGLRALRALAGRVRRPEMLRTVGELADAMAAEPWRQTPVVRTVVHRRDPVVPRVDWDAVLGDAASHPIPYRAARLIAHRSDAPEELVLRTVADHPDLAALLPEPTPRVLAELSEGRAGASVLVKVAGNGLVAGTLSLDDLPGDLLGPVAESLWLPGLRSAAALRHRLGRAGDVPLRPFFVDETGHGARRRLRDPSRRSHWDPAAVYGQAVAQRLKRDGELSADAVLALVQPDEVLAPDGVMPDPRVLRRLAEHAHEHLGDRPEAWMVALRLLEEGFAGTLPELLMTAGAVTTT
ncbi:hypothetical protein [Spirillospora sp. CA-294931]|uniref:hypothetical protein n=1 Tax=Spirillospora sp. CA-294931 TaxID=3240042 RepID=UPI003D910FA7